MKCVGWWNIDRDNVDWMNVDLSSVDLRVADERHIDLRNIDHGVKRVHLDSVGQKGVDLIDIDRHGRFDSGDGDCGSNNHGVAVLYCDGDWT